MRRELFFRREIERAKSLINDSNYKEAFHHLENAHIVGQNSVRMHTVSHLYMLKIGLLRRDVREVFGQIIRIPLGIIGSAVGIVPTGNTGGANVSIFEKRKIPEELEDYLK